MRKGYGEEQSWRGQGRPVDRRKDWNWKATRVTLGGQRKIGGIYIHTVEDMVEGSTTCQSTCPTHSPWLQHEGREYTNRHYPGLESEETDEYLSLRVSGLSYCKGWINLSLSNSLTFYFISQLIEVKSANQRVERNSTGRLVRVRWVGDGAGMRRDTLSIREEI